MKIKKGYSFDDLLLVPSKSSVNSRKDVCLIPYFGPLMLKIPIIGSPMKGIMSKELASELSDLGGIGILHRFYNSVEEQLSDIDYLYTNNKNFGVAVGIDVEEIYRVLEYNPKIICVDVANGYIEKLHKFLYKVKTELLQGSDILLMSGNVVTKEGANLLADSGVDIVRVGIGNGGLCSTSNVTGVGYPQLSAIYDCAKSDALVKVCDGGIRNSGDIVKALAAGADAVMIGSLFGRAVESANNGIIYGMASRKLQEEYYHNTKSIEGLEKEVKKDKTLKEIVTELCLGIQSACTYLNTNFSADLSLSARWVEIGKGTLKEL